MPLRKHWSWRAPQINSDLSELNWFYLIQALKISKQWLKILQLRVVMYIWVSSAYSSIISQTDDDLPLHINLEKQRWEGQHLQYSTPKGDSHLDLYFFPQKHWREPFTKDRTVEYCRAVLLIYNLYWQSKKIEWVIVPMPAKWFKRTKGMHFLSQVPTKLICTSN